MRIYSPSQTATWLECPVKRGLAYQEKWMPRRLGKRDLAAILGGAVAAGIGAWHNIRQAYQQADSCQLNNPYTCPAGIEHKHPADNNEQQQACAGVGVVIAQRRLAELEQLGATVGDYDRSQRDSLADRVHRAVSKYIEWDASGRAIPPSWQILDVERTLPDHGHARIDLGVDDGQGPAVVDAKVKLQLKREYRERELDRYRHSWQMLHYAWAYGQVLGVTIRRYYICLIVLEPSFAVELVPFTVEPEHMAQWVNSAHRVWAQMAHEDNGDADPWMNAKHADEYGNCEFYDACFTHKWDPALMAADYIRKEPA